MQKNINHLLHHTFGHKKFRGSQRDVIEHLINGENALVIMATGSGKSLCFQIPGLIREGVTVVISPLIALMKDQVFALQQLGIKAACLHADIHWQEMEELESQIKMQELDFLYLSPERLIHESMQDIFNRIDISLFVIDEAHCIWRWGYQFRPEYQQLSFIVENFPKIPRIALTATAGKLCKQAILDELQISENSVFEDDLDRENICYWVQPKHQAKDQLLTFIKNRHFENDSYHSGIIYCQTRAKTEQLTTFLRKEGIHASFYHAGIESEQRWNIQNGFLKGEIPIIVATVAFGMGINKPDIRFIAHMDLPKNLDAYYQEIGRAGRDGEPADAWMLFGLRDFQQLSSWLQGSQLSLQKEEYEKEQIQALLKYVISGSCRRINLLKAFDFDYKNQCENCDNCFSPRSKVEGSKVAAMALSTIYRTGQKFGIDHLIKVLRGKKTASILKNNHNQLSVFGLGSEKSLLYWRAVFFQLLQQQAISFHGQYCELVKLNSSSKLFLKFESEFSFFELHYFNSIQYSENRHKGELLHQPLLQMLRNCRSQLADKFHLLAFQIVAEVSLMELAENPLTDSSKLQNIEGFADEKIQLYGQHFINVCIDYKRQMQQQAQQLLLELGEDIKQKSLEQYVINKQMTLQQLSKLISQLISLSLLSLDEILPFINPVIMDLSNSTELTPITFNNQHIKESMQSHKISTIWLPCIKLALKPQTH